MLFLTAGYLVSSKASKDPPVLNLKYLFHILVVRVAVSYDPCSHLKHRSLVILTTALYGAMAKGAARIVHRTPRLCPQ